MVRCNYCNRAQKLPSQTQAQPTPQGWHPPPFWTPPPQYHVPHTPLVYHAPPKSAGCGAAFVMLPMLLIGGVAAAVAFNVHRAPPTTAANDATGWKGTTPFTCDVTGQNLVIDGVHMKNALPKPIAAGSACRLEIKNSTLRGVDVIEVGMGANVTVRDTTIIADRKAVSALASGRVELHNVTIKLAGESASVDGSVAIDAGMGANIDVHGMTLAIGGSNPVGQAYAVVAEAGSSVKLDKATITGPYKMRVEAGATVNVTNSQLQSVVEGDFGSVRGMTVLQAAPFASASAKPTSARPPPRPTGARPAPKPAPAPTTPPKNACNCAPGDINCTMRCNMRR